MVEYVCVTLQKNEGKVRAMVSASGDLPKDKFRELLFGYGGQVAVVRQALDQLGVTAEVEKGSGVFRGLGHNIDTEDALRKNFRFQNE